MVSGPCGIGRVQGTPVLVKSDGYFATTDDRYRDGAKWGTKYSTGCQGVLRSADGTTDSLPSGTNCKSASSSFDFSTHAPIVIARRDPGPVSGSRVRQLLDPTIDGINFGGIPRGVCAGSSMKVSINVDTPASAYLGCSPRLNGEASLVDLDTGRTVDRTSIDGQRASVRTGIDADIETPAVKSYRVEAEVEGQTASRTFEVDIRAANVLISGATFPDSVQPGSAVRGTLTVINTGDCPASVSVSGDRVGTERIGRVPGGASRQATLGFQMPGDDATIDLAVENETTGEEADTYTQPVSPREVAILNTPPSGELAIYGGFGGRVSYTGIAYGTGFQGESLEEGAVKAGFGTASFAGTVASGGVDVDRIQFSQLSYLQVQFDREALVYKDGEEAGRFDTFTYNATPLPTRLFTSSPGEVLRPNPLNPRSVLGAVAGGIPLPPWPSRSESESAFE